MPKIQIGTDIINFPNSGTDALWSPSVIQFAELVADTLNGIASPYDISPQVLNLTTDINNEFVLPGTEFPKVAVRKFSLSYAIYRTRTNSSLSVTESGTFTGIYNSKTSQWEWQDEYNGDRQPNGDAYHEFKINSEDKVTLTTTSIGIPGSPYDSLNSKISYSAKTLLVDNL